MESALEMGDGDPRIPKLAAGWERRGRPQSPAEGFLLSRIDGCTPWTMLREIGGLPPEEVDRCLERWLSEGLVEVAEARETRSEAGGGPREVREARSAGARPREQEVAYETDPKLDLPVELQVEILKLDADLERPYHELLGVARNADTKTIKRAYFALSRKYHPDRYFRQQIGDFHKPLDRIFKKLVEAYELLSDPATRAEIERSLAQQPMEEDASGDAEAVETPTAAPPQAGAQPPSDKLDKRELLERLRRAFRIPEEVLAERKFKARQFYDASRVAATQESWLEAAASARLAIAFDPWEREYKQAFGEVQAKVHEIRATQLLERANASLDGSAQQEALHLYEEVLHYRPGDADLNHRTARLALQLEELEKAREYAERACECEPAVCAHHVTLARVLRKSGLREKARRALDEARRLDPKDPEVKAEMSALQRMKRHR